MDKFWKDVRTESPATTEPIVCILNEDDKQITPAFYRYGRYWTSMGKLTAIKPIKWGYDKDLIDHIK